MKYAAIELKSQYVDSNPQVIAIKDDYGYMTISERNLVVFDKEDRVVGIFPLENVAYARELTNDRG